MQHESINRVPQYKWAKTVKQLDDNRCVHCGRTERLEAHHIIPKALDPDEANNLENGITLCFWCHRSAHGIGYHRANETPPAIDPNTRTGQMLTFIQNYADTSILLAVPEKQLNKIKAHAERMGESVNGFINRAIEEAMIRDKER